ncbi:hypothetical protein M1403_01100 [Patescibacteria group bacterium]|nr:hypothetical protein [Patescibacteria group bacterium]
MQKLQQEQNLRQEKVSGLVVLVLFVIVGLLSAGRVFAANRLVETSDSLRRLDQQISKLETENQKLAEETRSQQSMLSVEQRVKTLGFTKTDKYAYLSARPEMAMGKNAGTEVMP